MSQKKMSESEIQKRIISWLESQGAYVIKTIVTNRSGVPDIIACLGGKFIGIEVKAEKNTTTALQKYNLNAIRKAGGTAAQIHSVGEAMELAKSELNH